MTVPYEGRSLAELEEDRDFLLRSLEDLEQERTAGDIADHDYARLRDDYTGRAAAVLKAIETARAGRPSSETAAPVAEAAAPGPPPSAPAAGPSVPTPTSAPTVPAPPRTPWWRSPRSILIAVGIVAFSVVVGTVLGRAVGGRLENEPLTGAVTPTGVSDDLARAQQLISQGRTLDAIQLYDRILEEDPRQPEALAYRGWLVRLVGREADNQALVDKGLEFLDRAVAADPGYPDAHFFRGMVLLEDKGDPAGAVPEFRAYLAGNPPAELVPLVEGKLNQALAMLNAGSPPASEPPPAPPAAPPG
ncbi:MAG TPA: tetratricopeptide repeat protein [Acidimicrobiales bacterium]|nr:tetratricopeptide repeat protein [Acidimicrobiales bacterium]